MVIALTGATGFVGRALVPRLLEAGHVVRILVRHKWNPQDPQFALQDMPENLASGKLQVVQGDVQQPEALKALTRDATAVIHLAGAIQAPSAAAFFAVNVQGTAHVVAAARAACVPRFIHVSSLAARAPELSAYAASKAAGEGEVQRLSDAALALIIRPPAVYGPGDKATLPLMKALTSSLAIIPGKRNSRFSLIYVQTLADILLEAVGSNRIGLVEVSDGQHAGYNWDELAAIASNVEGRKITPLFLPKGLLNMVAYGVEAIARLRGQPAFITREKLRELYHEDWVSQGEGGSLKNSVAFAEGFHKTISWYRANGWLPLAKHHRKKTAII